jgi:hypothetical protein
VVLAGKINKGIQWILKKTYIVVNKNYLGLSREMEFHADEIAASVTGYEPLKKSLLRMGLADTSFNNVLNFYNSKISDNIKSVNVFHDQSAVINFIADINGLTLTNQLPDIKLEEQNKYNKSRLVIKDQWSSHPTTEERINRLIKTGFSTTNTSDSLANSIFTDITKLQKQISDKLFETVSYEGEIKEIASTSFLDEFKNDTLINSFSDIYNGYYDNKNPQIFDLSNGESNNGILTMYELFSDEKVDLVYTAFALQNDIETLKSISNKELLVKTFDYNGIKYKSKKSGKLIEELMPELEKLNELIKLNDYKIYEFFKSKEQQQNKPDTLEKLYIEFFEFDKNFDSKYGIYTNLINRLQFVSLTTPFDKIKSNFKEIEPDEALLKSELNRLLSDSLLKDEITVELKEKLAQFSSAKLDYFGGVSYDEENLDLLFSAINTYAYLLSRKYFIMKRNLLSYQEELIKN